MSNSRAAAWARGVSRDAMPTISLYCPACMLGITRLTAIFATPNTPHRTFFMTWQLYRGAGAGGGGGVRGSGVAAGWSRPARAKEDADGDFAAVQCQEFFHGWRR